LGERGFAETGRAVEENVIEGFTAIASGFEGDGDIFFDALLADVFGEGFGANAGVEAGVFVGEGAGNDTGGAVGMVGGGHGVGDEDWDIRYRAVDIRYRISDIGKNEECAAPTAVVRSILQESSHM
jgi:hypothetical protein